MLKHISEENFSMLMEKRSRSRRKSKPVSNQPANSCPMK